MDQENDSDCHILEEEDEDQPQSPAELPAEQQEQGLFVCVGNDIFEQDDPPPVPASQPSLYGASQLAEFVNVPSQEDLGVPPCSPETEAALRPVSIADWNAEVEQNNAPLPPILEEDKQDVGHFHDPCLPSPPAKPIPLDQGCSGQRFEQGSVQSEPSGLWVQEFFRDMERKASHQDTSDAITGHSSKPRVVSNCRLELVGERMLRDWFQPQRDSV